MSFQVLARKWRPRKFADVIGQAPLVRTLQNALISGDVAHGYLFCGTRGVGKTTLARIFAKALCCQSRSPESPEPCCLCAACESVDNGHSFNVLEIDGAGHNGVEHVRQLIENLPYLPTQGKYKIYIIDEVHMLSTSAFNALLKSLEEPPAHVVFIFATTDPEKIPETVLSRLQRLDLYPQDLQELVRYLKVIAEKEGVRVQDPHSLEILATMGRGSIRDTLTLMDQALSFNAQKVLDEDSLVKALGIPRKSGLRTLTEALFDGNITQLRKTYLRFLQENVTVDKIIRGVLDHLYQVVVGSQDPTTLESQGFVSARILKNIEHAELLWIYECLAKDFTWSLSSLSPEKVTEIILHKVCLRRTFLQPTLPSSPPETLQVSAPKVLGPDPLEATRVRATPEIAPVAEEKIPEIKPKGQPLEVVWENFVKNVFKKYPALGANLEQGNILKTSVLEGEHISVHVGLGETAQVFLEYLKELEVHRRLLKELASFFSVPEQNIRLDFSLIDEKTRQLTHFESQVELEEKRKQRILEERKLHLMNNPMLKQAEKLFNSSVDKVIVNDIIRE